MSASQGLCVVIGNVGIACKAADRPSLAIKSARKIPQSLPDQPAEEDCDPTGGRANDTGAEDTLVACLRRDVSVSRILLSGCPAVHVTTGDNPPHSCPATVTLLLRKGSDEASVTLLMGAAARLPDEAPGGRRSSNANNIPPNTAREGRPRFNSSPGDCVDGEDDEAELSSTRIG